MGLGYYSYELVLPVPGVAPGSETIKLSARSLTLIRNHIMLFMAVRQHAAAASLTVHATAYGYNVGAVMSCIGTVSAAVAGRGCSARE